MPLDHEARGDDTSSVKPSVTIHSPKLSLGEASIRREETKHTNKEASNLLLLLLLLFSVVVVMVVVVVVREGGYECSKWERKWWFMAL